MFKLLVILVIIKMYTRNNIIVCTLKSQSILKIEHFLFFGTLGVSCSSWLLDVLHYNESTPYSNHIIYYFFIHLSENDEKQVYLLLLVTYFEQWYAFLRYCYISSLHNFWTFHWNIMLCKCNWVDPLRLDLAKWKTTLKQ